MNQEMLHAMKRLIQLQKEMEDIFISINKVISYLYKIYETEEKDSSEHAV